MSCFSSSNEVKKEDMDSSFREAPMQPAVLHEEYQATQKLSQFGLQSQYFENAIKAGYLAWASCTDNDTPMYPGITFWNHIHRTLRENLIPIGWKKSDEGGYSRIVSPDENFAIAVSSACAGVGNVNYVPSTNPKGNCTIEIVEHHAVQLQLSNTVLESKPRTPRITTWFLLFYKDKDEIRMELSLPAVLSKDARIIGWYERVFLDSIPIDNIPLLNQRDFGEDIEVEVRKKA
jgi:hypothetical protein